jgi:hypothetical protein
MIATPFALANWLPVAFDPVLILVAVLFGWKADQAGKLIVAVIAALAASVLVGWIMGTLGVSVLGLQWPGAIGGEQFLLLQVRAFAALLWSGLAFGARRLAKR